MASEQTQPTAASEESNVCVAVKIRPLVSSEIDDGCRESLFVTPGCPQVSSGQHTFTYDHVFGEGGTAPDQLYPRCIAPLVDGLFKGYNATVFAYGQTGSGKTFTMGSEYKPGARCRGVIPDTINDIFHRIDAAKDRAVTVRVSFVEIHKEEVKDLLLPTSNGPRPAVTIRETPSGDVALYGAVEKEVRSREEMAEVLELGTLCRSTASTSMNNRSSRSHAIFTITMEQRRQVQHVTAQGGDEDGDDDEDATGEEAEGVEDFLGAKMHLVDLAGSERAKRTKAEGARLREGIHINRGLLALGNVINAIVDNHKHVPYRDSKLTRLLQDSLGGNSRTVMIACVSPADSNFEESLNTLRYADRARHIRNKPVVNRDPVAAQLAVLRNAIAQLKSENLTLKRALAANGNGEGTFDVMGTSGLGNGALEGLVDRLTQESTSLESDNMRLKMEMDELRQELAVVTEKWHTAQAQCDLLRMNQAAAAAGLQHRRESAGGPDRNDLPLPGLDIVKGYVARISELEAEVKNLKSLAVHLPFARRRPHGLEPRTPGGVSIAGDLEAASPGSASVLGGASALEGDAVEAEGDDDPALNQQTELAVEEDLFMAEVAAHTLQQEKMKKEMALLQRQLEAKERKMVELMKNAGSMPALKQHYDRVLADLEAQRDTLVAERKALMEKLNAVSAANEEERKRLEATYTERIHQYDDRLKELRRKERDFIAMQKLKQRTEDAHRRLSADIVRLKQQKVAVQKQLDANAKQFAAWRHERERELGQLRKQSRKDRAQIQHLQAMAAKQSAVLQRKISDATAARKRIKELEEEKRRKAASVASQHQAAAALAAQQAMGGNVEIQSNPQAPLLRTDKDRHDWLQKELEMCSISCEFRKVMDGELAQRAEATRKLKDLEKRLTLLDQEQPASPLFMSSIGNAVLPSGITAGSAGGALGAETREKLLAKKKELEEKVAYHNDQITELQADWERQKAEEESRGGGALDVRRWAGLRNVAECRELLRTLFRMSVESKTLSNELTVDLVRFMEEVDVLRVQLDGAQKKCAQYRKLAITLQTAAAHVATAPNHSTMSTQDETDKQVDAVLEALHVVRSNTPPAATGAAARSAGAAVAEADATPVVDRFGGNISPAGGTDVEMQDANSPGTPTASPNNSQQGPAKALEFLSPVPSGAQRRLPPFDAHGAAAQRYSPDHNGDSDDNDDQQQVGRAARRGTRQARRNVVLSDDMDVDEDPDNAVMSDDSDSDDTDSEEEDDKESSSGDDDSDGDDDWNPNNATPAVRGRRRASRLACGGGGSRHSSSRQSAAQSAASSDGIAAVGDEEPTPDAFGQRASGARSRQGTSSRRSSKDDAVALYEAQVLDDINLKRMYESGGQRLTKLTVKHLTEALKGKIIDGKRWCARGKTRAVMIQDYMRMLGLPTPTASEPQSLPQSPAPEAKACDGRALADGSTSTAAAGRNRRDKSSGGGADVSVGGARHADMVQADPSSPATEEGFTFSPHLPVAPTAVAPGPQAVPPLAVLRATSPSHTPSGRRAGNGGNVCPWARSYAHSARQPTTWASSLRSSLPSADTTGGFADAAAPGPGLARSNSVVNTRELVRGPSSAADAPAASSRRPSAWGSTFASQGVAGHGAPLSYRGAVLSSPQQSTSPRLPRPPTVAGASPRSSRGSPSPSSVPRCAGTARGDRAFSSSPDARHRGFGYTGGENMQPESATPCRGGSAEGKSSTPLTSHYKEKAAASRERTAALRVSMHKNWEQQEPQLARATANNSLRSSLNGSVGTNGGTTGTVNCSNDGQLRGAATVRDSSGTNGALAKQKQKPQGWR